MSLREMVSAGLGEQDFLDLVFDHFREVHDGFGAAMPHPQKVRDLVGWCERQDRVEDLIAAVEAKNATVVERFRTGQRAATDARTKWLARRLSDLLKAEGVEGIVNETRVLRTDALRFREQIDSERDWGDLGPVLASNVGDLARLRTDLVKWTVDIIAATDYLLEISQLDLPSVGISELRTIDSAVSVADHRVRLVADAKALLVRQTRRLLYAVRDVVG